MTFNRNAGDLDEAIRYAERWVTMAPDVDAHVRSLLEKRVFQRADFFETRGGNCRLMPTVARLLAETGPRWGQLLAPVVEDIATRLSQAHPSRTSKGKAPRVPTRLTEQRRRTGRDAFRKRSVPRTPVMPRVPQTCTICGVALPQGSQTYCPACWSERKQRAAKKVHAATTRYQTRTEAKRARLASAPGTQHPDAEQFVFGILPGLQRVSANTMARATGLSVGYCAKIKQSQQIPHQRHWPTLVALP